MANRLANATSPYLLQHAENPVDWWEWGPEAFAEAKRRDAPILLCVGYAACHWCHVMAHESFEDEATAAYLNEHFVSIKVDREERPDVDAVYMQATVAITGHGGWPMTCVLDHEGRPFFAGTYFPDQPRHGQPSFVQLLQAITEAWRERRDDVDAAAARHRAPTCATCRRLAGAAPIDAAVLEAAVAQLSSRVRHRQRRFRRCAEVPAVDGAGVPAASARAHRAMRGREMARDTCRGDGARRDVRPARRRLRALLRRRRAGWCRTSRRCSTTTRCCSGLHVVGEGFSASSVRVGGPLAPF